MGKTHRARCARLPFLVTLIPFRRWGGLSGRAHTRQSPWTAVGVKGVGRPRVAGAAYGAAGALRTVRTWYAPDDARPFYAGRLASVRDEDGSLRVYDYRNHSTDSPSTGSKKGGSK